MMHPLIGCLVLSLSLSTRMARWGLVIVGIYGVVALITPVLVAMGWMPDANAGLANPIYAPPNIEHWCGTDRLGRDVCMRTMAGSGVALQVVLLAVGVPAVATAPAALEVKRGPRSPWRALRSRLQPSGQSASS